jgi:hypothetical protein
MQTFLPLESFTETATILDMRRLGKQRVEGFQVLEALAGVESRWIHHPAVVMWKGCEFLLSRYIYTMCAEWRQRGYQDGIEVRTMELMEDALRADVLTPEASMGRPWWLGAEGFHLSHRSNLLKKDPAYYRKYWPNDPDCLGYVWPEWREPVRMQAA